MNDLDLDLVGLAWPAFFFLMLCSCCECNCVDAPHQYAVTTQPFLYFCFEKNKNKMQVVGNLVEPQQYCQIHIERKHFRIPSMLPYFEN